MLVADSIVHTLTPFAVEFGGGFGIRWYGLAYAIGFALGWLLLRWMSRTGRILLTEIQLGDYIFYCVMGVILGGRLGHVLFYDLPLLWSFHASFPWWGVLDIHLGGMSSHGGIIGVALAAVLYSRRSGVPLLHLLDCTAFAAPPGLGLGRLGNWVNGELIGRPLPVAWHADPPWWSVKFPSELLHESFPRMQEVMALRRAGLVDPAAPFPDSLVIACYASKQPVIDAIAPLLTPYWPSQFFQAITDGPILLAALALAWWRPRRPGVVAGWFIACYGALRLITEQFREPDHGVISVGPMTLPMLLSVGMILLGGAIVMWASRRNDVAPLGGLRRLRPQAA